MWITSMGNHGGDGESRNKGVIVVLVLFKALLEIPQFVKPKHNSNVLDVSARAILVYFDLSNMGWDSCTCDFKRPKTHRLPK